MSATRRPAPLLAPKPVAAAVALALLGFSGAHAAPTGGQVVGGAATIQKPNASTTLIQQSTPRAALNWNTFSIAASESVIFKQPSASSVVLNRVVGADPSLIFGTLQANGQVFLVNPSGVLFARGASVDVGGLVASTLGISNPDFMAGRYVFSGGSSAGAVVNHANIRAANGGYVAFLGNQVTNTGTITAERGTVALAAGDTMHLDFHGDGLLTLKVDAAAAKAKVEHDGMIQADGGQVFMTVRAKQALMSTAINVEGIVQAKGLAERNGKIVLDGGRGVTSVSGTLDASSANAGQKGGDVRVLGEYVGLFGNARVDASGANGGGTVLVGGDFQGGNPDVQNAFRTYVGPNATIKADALTSGDGGKVIVWADDVNRYFGNISARGGSQRGNGGFAEVSGKETLIFEGAVDLRAPKGKAGTLLLDPRDIYVQDVAAADVNGNTPTVRILTTDLDQFTDNPAENSSISTLLFVAALDAGNVTLKANNDIVFVNNVTTTAGNFALTLHAGRTIDIRGNIAIGGTFEAIANIADATVVQANRATASAGEFRMTNARTISTTNSLGNGNILIRVQTGDPDIALAADRASGNITVSSLNAGTGNVLLDQAGATLGSSITRTATSLITAATATLDVSNAANTTGAIGTSGAGNAMAVTLTGPLAARTRGGSVFVDSPTAALTIGPAGIGVLTGISTAGGDAIVSSAAALTLNEAINTQPPGNGTTIGGRVLLESVGALTIANDGATTFGQIRTKGQDNNAGTSGAGGEVFLSRTAAVNAPITLGGGITATGGDATGAGNNGGSGGPVTIANANGTLLINSFIDVSGGSSAAATQGNANTIQLRTAGANAAITQSGETAATALLATGGTTGRLAVTSATGDVTLTNDSNDVRELAANIATAGAAFRYTDANALFIESVPASGTLTSPSGLVANPGAPTVGIRTRGGAGGLVEVNALGALGTLTVNQPINTQPTGNGTSVGGSVLLESGGALTIANDGATTFGEIRTKGQDNSAGASGPGGEVFVSHTGAVNAPITLGGGITATGGDASGAGNNGGSGGPVTIANNDGTLLIDAFINVSGGTSAATQGNANTIQLRTAGANSVITQSGELAATALLATGGTTGRLAVTSATGDVTLTNNSNDVRDVAANIITAGVAFRYTDANALFIESVAAAGTLVAPSALAANPGAPTVGIRTLGDAGGLVEVNALSALGTLAVNRPINTQPPGNGATVGGSVLLESGAALTIANDGATTFGEIRTKGQDNNAGTSGAGGEVFLSHTTAVNAPITLGGSITATGGDATGGGNNGGAGGPVTIANADGALLINAFVNVSGGSSALATQGNANTIQLRTAGTNSAITQTGELPATALLATGGTTGALTVVSATGDVTLNNDSNDVTRVAAAIPAAGKFFNYTDTNALEIDTVAAAGSLVAPSGAAALPLAATTGITTADGDIFVIAGALTTGTLTVKQLVDGNDAGAAAGAVNLVARDNVIVQALVDGGRVALQAGANVDVEAAGSVTRTAGTLSGGATSAIFLEADSPHTPGLAASNDGVGALTITGTVASNNAPITLTGAEFFITNTVNAGSGQISVARSRSSDAITINNVAANLNPAEIQLLLSDTGSTTAGVVIGHARTAGTDRLGAAGAERLAPVLSVNEPLDLTGTVTDTLVLVASGTAGSAGVSQTAAGVITVANLGARTTVGGVDLGVAINNVVRVGIEAPLTQDVRYRDVDAFRVARIIYQDPVLQAARTLDGIRGNNIVLHSENVAGNNGGLIDQEAPIVGTNLGVRTLAGGVNLQFSDVGAPTTNNDVAGLAVEATGLPAAYRDATGFEIRDVTSFGTQIGFPVGITAADVILHAENAAGAGGGTITQTRRIEATNFGVRTFAGGVDLQLSSVGLGNNEVTGLAIDSFNSTTSTRFNAAYRDATGFTIQPVTAFGTTIGDPIGVRGLSVVLRGENAAGGGGGLINQTRRILATNLGVSTVAGGIDLSFSAPGFNNQVTGLALDAFNAGSSTRFDILYRDADGFILRPVIAFGTTVGTSIAVRGDDVVLRAQDSTGGGGGLIEQTRPIVATNLGVQTAAGGIDLRISDAIFGTNEVGSVALDAFNPNTSAVFDVIYRDASGFTVDSVTAFGTNVGDPIGVRGANVILRAQDVDGNGGGLITQTRRIVATNLGVRTAAVGIDLALNDAVLGNNEVSGVSLDAFNGNTLTPFDARYQDANAFELDRVTAFDVTVGNPIAVRGANVILRSQNAAGGGGGAITQSRRIEATNLGVLSVGGSVNLGFNDDTLGNNEVTGLAINAFDTANSVAFDVRYREATGFTIQPVTAFGTTIGDPIGLRGANVVLRAQDSTGGGGGEIAQTRRIEATNLGVRSAGGGISLGFSDAALGNNSVSGLAIDAFNEGTGTAFDASYRDANAIAIEAVTSLGTTIGEPIGVRGANVVLRSENAAGAGGGLIGQTRRIEATNLGVRTVGGGVDLQFSDAVLGNNNVTGLAVEAAGLDVAYRDTNAFTVRTVTAFAGLPAEVQVGNATVALRGSNIVLRSGAAGGAGGGLIDQTQAILGTNLGVINVAGGVNLQNADNDVVNFAVSAPGQNVAYRDANALESTSVTAFGTTVSDIVTAGLDNGAGPGGAGGDVTLTTVDGSLAVRTVTSSGGNATGGDNNGGAAGTLTFNVGGAGNTLTFNGNPTSRGGNASGSGTSGGAGKGMLLGVPVILGTNVVVDTRGGTAGTGGTAGADGTVTFGSNVNADVTANNRTLTVNAGGASVIFQGNVGNNAPLADLDVNAGSIVFSGASPQTIDVSAQGGNTIGFNAPVVLAQNVSINTNGAADSDIAFASTVNADGSGNNPTLTIDTGTGMVTFPNGVGNVQELGGLRVSGSQLVTNGDIRVSGGGDVDFGNLGTLTMISGGTIDTDRIGGATAGGNIVFGATTQLNASGPQLNPPAPTLTLDANADGGALAGNVTLGVVGSATTRVNVLVVTGNSVTFAGAVNAEQVFVTADRVMTTGEGRIVASRDFDNDSSDLNAALKLQGLTGEGVFGERDTPIQIDAPGLFVVFPNSPNTLLPVFLAGDPDKKPVYEFADDASARQVFYNGAAPDSPSSRAALSAITQQLRALLDEINQAGFAKENIRRQLLQGLILETGLSRPGIDDFVGEGVTGPQSCTAIVTAGGALACQ